MRGRFTGVALAGALVTGCGGIAFAQAPYALAQPAWKIQGLRATRALNLLEDQGDGQFSSFSASGADFTADVIKDGKTMAVLIRPNRQQIQPIGNAG